MASRTVNITVAIEAERFSIQIDEAKIQSWIEGRLNDARNTFVRGMSGGGGGRTYGNHTASSPGEYPATQSGRLANSVDYEMHGTREGTLTSDVEYASYLTTGTSHMAARKMLADALEETLDANMMEAELAQAITIVGH